MSADRVKKPRFLTQKELNIIRGRASAGAATPAEILSIFAHYDLLEQKLDEADEGDMLGTEGWRHFFRLPNAE